MKRSITAIVSSLVLSAAIAPVAFADPVAYNPNARTTVTANPSAFELVSLANQGYLAVEGIPSQGSLVTEYRNGRVTADTVIQAAVRADRVSPDMASNPSYVSAVEAALDTFTYTR